MVQVFTLPVETVVKAIAIYEVKGAVAAIRYLQSEGQLLADIVDLLASYDDAHKAAIDSLVVDLGTQVFPKSN